MATVDEKTEPKRERVSDDPASDSDSAANGAGGVVARLKQRIPAKLSEILQSRRAIAICAGGISLAVFVLWFIFHQRDAPQIEQLQNALKLLEDPRDYASRQEAATIALELRSAGYQDPDFQSGPAYVLGIVEFRDAHQENESVRDEVYLRAVRYLREADRSAFDLKYRPEFVFALGVSLYRVGSRDEAVSFLQEAIDSYPSGKTEASTLLAEIYLERKTPSELRRALQLTDSVLESVDLSVQEKDRHYLQKAQIHLALKQELPAREALSKVSDVEASNHATMVFRAEALMADAEILASSKGISSVSQAATLMLRSMSEDRFRAAQDKLDPVANAARLEQTFKRRALFLQGICAQRIAEIDVENVSATKYDAAINIYSRTVENFKDSHEGIAASLRLADLLRASSRDEEALIAYGNALASVTSPSRFRNRWISLSEFRATILNAWHAWARKGQFYSAIKLSKLMSPLVPEIQSLELLALANQRWADRLTREFASTVYSQRMAKRKQIMAQWRESGDSYAKLAKLVVTSPRYPEILWSSAEHYKKGHAFKKSLDQLTRFINLRPKNKLPLAIVRRGQVLMDLDRFKEAKEHFQRVIDSYPTDTAAFRAQFEIANCHFELGDVDQAEKSWRNILSSEHLNPDATEWRESLFSLSRLLFHSAVIIRDRAEHASKGASTAEFLTALKLAVAKWEVARRWLKEYIERYPQSENINEARFLLAKTLQEIAQLPQFLLKDAEVENVKVELRRNMSVLLNEARNRFRDLQTKLLRMEEPELLDSLGQRFLRDCYFEIGHTSFSLGDFRKAIDDYNSAAGRYPRDPQVLLAYLQMANCNDRLGSHGEAVSMIVQAKVILKQLPDEAFKSGNSGLTKKEWTKWLDWARLLRRNTKNRPRLVPPPGGPT